MEERDKPGFESLMLALGSTFRVEVTAPMRVGYWLGLSDLPFQAVQEAAAKAMRASRFMPVPRELRDMAGVITVDQRAIIAWGAVKKAIASVGAYRSVVFDDPAVTAAIRTLGGWPRVCGTDSEELDKWTSKEFQRLYRALDPLQMGGGMTRHLPGIFEQEGGHTKIEPPVKVTTGTLVEESEALQGYRVVPGPDEPS